MSHDGPAYTVLTHGDQFPSDRSPDLERLNNAVLVEQQLAGICLDRDGRPLPRLRLPL